MFFRRMRKKNQANLHVDDSGLCLLADGADGRPRGAAGEVGRGRGDLRTGLLKLREVPERPRTRLGSESEERHGLGCVLGTTPEITGLPVGRLSLGKWEQQAFGPK